MPREDPRRGRPQQWFTLRPWLFDVTAATGLLRAAPRPARPLPVEAWARAYGLLPGGSPHMVFLLGPGPGFDPYYAMTTDLGEPVIIATLTGPAGELAGPLLIDGCHRLYKAARLGRVEIPALVLTAEETRAICHDAAPGPPRQPQAQPAQLFPVTEDEDVAVIDGEDGRAQFGPASWVLAGPWCAWWRGGGQSVVISVMAARALCSSTMFLRAAQAATRAWVARLLTARGRPRAASWMRVMASSLNRVSDRPASLR